MLKLLVPVQTFELLWTRGNFVNPWPFKVEKFTNWDPVFALTEHKGITVKVFVPDISCAVNKLRKLLST